MSIDANAIENSNIEENHVGKFASLSRSNRFLVSALHLYEIKFIIRKQEIKNMSDKYIFLTGIMLKTNIDLFLNYVNVNMEIIAGINKYKP